MVPFTVLSESRNLILCIYDSFVPIVLSSDKFFFKAVFDLKAE